MSSPRPSFAPPLDLPNLAVHALWWVWCASFLWSWEGLGLGGRGAMLVLGAGVMFWNYAVLHNHMHVPIAFAPALRWGVSRSLGLACGFAYRGYYIHHFNHHKFNDGPGDWGKRRPGESVFGYCARWTLTPWVWPFGIVGKVWGGCKTRKDKLELLLDFALVDGSLLALVLWRPAQGLAYFGMLLVGQFCIYWLNLAAHHGTNHSHRDQLGVTSTSRLYNLFFFNAGYHQLHHVKPQVPWRDLPLLTQDFAAVGKIPTALQTPLAPINPRWVALVVRGYGSEPCARQKDSTTTSDSPSAAI
jgi:fatty acid desaturase